MAPGFRIDLRVLGEKLPGGVQRFGRKAAKAAEKPVGIAHDLMYPETLLEPTADKLANPVVAARLSQVTIATRAHILGIADLPAIEYEHSGSLSMVLLRMRVERPDGDAETCVRQCLPEAIRRITPGSSLRALAHETDRRIAVFDWVETGARLGMKLSWPETLDQYAWPDREDWPAVDAIEVRDGIRHRGTLDRRRAEWTARTARLAGASSRGARVDGREQWQLDEIHVEEGRLDEVFRSITLPDTVNTVKAAA